MKRGLVIVAAILLVTTALAVACGGGGGHTGTTTGTPGGTGEAFLHLRDAFQQRLGAIGVNISAVPQDVRKQVLAQCNDLAQVADAQRVSDLCAAVQRAMDTGDFGLIDQVITQLALLQPK